MEIIIVFAIFLAFVGFITAYFLSVKTANLYLNLRYKKKGGLKVQGGNYLPFDLVIVVTTVLCTGIFLYFFSTGFVISNLLLPYGLEKTLMTVMYVSTIVLGGFSVKKIISEIDSKVS